MKTNIKTEIKTQLEIFSIPTVLITLVTDYLNEPLPLTNEERQTLAVFLLQIFGDLSINSKIAGGPQGCERYFLEWIPTILTAISKNKSVENPPDQNRPQRTIAEDLLSNKYYTNPQKALYELLHYTHNRCFNHPKNGLLNFIFVDILTKAKLIGTMRGLSFCIALHELAGIYRFNITKNMATALYKEILAKSITLENEKDQLLSRKKSYNQLGFDCRYLTYGGENGYLTLFPADSIKSVLALESKHLPITTSDLISDLDAEKNTMIQALKNFIKLNDVFHLLGGDVIKTQVKKCKHLLNMLETLDLNRNIAVQTILSQVSVYKSKTVTNDFQTTLEVVFKGMLNLSNKCISRLPAELYSSPSKVG